jgi:polyhydroxyalkanoate synthase subunit PhaC
MTAMSLVGRTAHMLRYLADDPVLTAKTGQTPHEVVFRMGKVQLRFFPPKDGVMKSERPVLISMPLINTWTVFDLLPGRSVIAKLTSAGIPVYVVDWGRPGDEDSERPMSYYVDEVLVRCFDRARRHSSRTFDTDSLDAIGYCVGGTFLAIHLSRYPEQAVRTAFVATPIDFHASERLSRWADPATFPLDTLISSRGNYPASMMSTSFQWLKPMGQTAKWWGLWDRIDVDGFPELWSALERWNNDNVDFPGETYREYVQRCYFDNALIEGGWVMGARPVDLSKCTMPTLVIGATTDHIAPPAACGGLERVWGGPCTVKTIRGGHVGICVGGTLPATLIEWFLPES